MQSACHTHSIFLVSMIMDFWTRNFQATVMSTFCSPLALEIQNRIENILSKCCVKFCGILLSSFEIMFYQKLRHFLDHPI